MKTKTHQTVQAEWEEKWKTLVLDVFLKKTNKGRYPLGQLEVRGIEFIRELLQSHEKQTAEDICKLIDDIECADYSNSSMDVWKLFKRIRNQIRDTYDPEGFQKNTEAGEWSVTPEDNKRRCKECMRLNGHDGFCREGKK